MQRIVSFTLFTLIGFSLYGQTNRLGSWNILHLRYPLNSKWTLFTEGQLRSLRFYANFHYHEWTGGVIYRPNRQVALTLAIGDYDTYREGGSFVKPKNNDEFRIWPQFTFTQEIGRVRLEHRYRSEQRFTLNGFRLRFRSRVGIQVPLNTKEMKAGTVFLSASNELFFTNKPTYFERNRLLLLCGKRFSDALTAHIGYVHQFDYRINDETGRGFLQVAIQYELKKT